MSELAAYEAALARNGYGDALASPFLAAWHALSSAYLQRLVEEIPAGAGWRERFRAGAALTLELAEDNPREARFLLTEPQAVGPVGLARQRAMRERLAARIDTARSELDAPESVPPATAEWLLGAFFDRIYRRVVKGAGPELPHQLPALLFLGVSAYFGTEAGLAEILR